MSVITFHRVLRLRSAGRDVIAVKRALSKAGYMQWGHFTPIFGPFMRKALLTFQSHAGVPRTGKYDLATHNRLLPYFDKWGRKLYEGSSSKPATPVNKPDVPTRGKLQLKQSFTPTHPTAGLPGFPAIDEFAEPGAQVLAPEDGRVVKLSGHDPRQGGVSGGAYGWSIYLASRTGEHYMTHFGSRTVHMGQTVRRGEVIGTVADSAISHKPGTSHIHHGKRT